MKVEDRKYKIKWIWDQWKAGQLVINQGYQRRGVWLLKHQVALIETILCDYRIPDIYIWERETDPTSGATTYEIVDGQQRIQAIVQYIGDGYALKPVSHEYEGAPFANKKFSELDGAYKSTIWDFTLKVQELGREETEDNIRALFLRLNKTNLSLNPQELRNAEFNGKFIQLSVDLADLPIWKKYDLFGKQQIRRMGDIQFCSSLLIFLRFGIDSESQELVNKAYDRFNEEYPAMEEDRQAIHDLAEMVDTILDASSELGRKPSHLYTLFTLAEKFRGTNIVVQDIHRKRWQRFSELHELGDTDALQGKLSDDDYERLQMYKAYSIQGTNKKQQRLGRLKILSKFIIEGFDKD